ITDLDSDQLSGATVRISTGAKTGDVLGFTAIEGNPITASWDANTMTLTLSGVASIAQYEAALKAVTFTTTEGGLPRGLTVSVTDEAEVASLVPGAALVTVIGLPPTVVTIGAPLFKLGGSPVRVITSASITDLDSDQLSGATVRIATGAKTGDVLSYSQLNGNPITASWDAETMTLTLSGVATIAQYEAALKAVTFTTTEGGLPRGLSVSVTDDAEVASLVPGAALVTVIGLPPAVVTIGAPLFKLGGSPVRVISSASITDLDSDQLSGATVRIATGAKTGDVLSFIAIEGNPITGTWDANTMTLTLSGVATIAQYEAALKAVTFTTTEGGLPRGLSVSVTDEAEVASVVPGAAMVTVIGLPPLLVVTGLPVHTIGTAPVRVASSVTITDADSTHLSGATVRISLLAQSGDVLGYNGPADGPITASWDNATKTLTLTGVATIAEYEAALKAVTFSATGSVLIARTISFSIVDETQVGGVELATVAAGAKYSLTPALTVLGTPVFRLGGTAVRVISVAEITDLDSDRMSQATLKLTGAKAGDVLNYVQLEGNPITGTWNAETMTLTLTGVATKAQYEAALKAVTFSTTEGGLPRGVTVAVADETGVESLLALPIPVTVVGLPPGLLVLGAPIHTIGTAPVRVASSVTITDADSTHLSGATVRISLLVQSGDTLWYSGPEDGPITASWDDASKTLTLSGVATIAEYEEALQSVMFSATGSVLATRTISFSVTDDTNVAALLPATVLAGSRYSLAPTVVTIGGETHVIGKAPVRIISRAEIGDIDSDYISRAEVQIALLGQPGDVLGYTGPAGPIKATWDAGSLTLTLSGVATKAQYEAALESVTFSATGGVFAIRTVSVTVTDDAGVSSVLPGTVTARAANPLAPGVFATGRAVPYSTNNSPVNPIVTAEIVDLDSDYMFGASVRISDNARGADLLAFAGLANNPITASWNNTTKTLTLSGTATKSQYEAALKAVTFYTTDAGPLFDRIRTIAITVTDDSRLIGTGSVPIAVTTLF
ncbi:hypothetical protein, partial [Mycobacterium sp. SMC-4]|uniref:hypothetical protein n=1 Tax=Mycobacterium sp. SMC-4 TaxID=2857059 RepID=UPI003D03CCC5